MLCILMTALVIPVFHANTFFYFPIYMKKLFTSNISVTLIVSGVSGYFGFKIC
jgi:hypothetical protein